jgi:glycerol dehydrogenase-like iron-containing ADH family enzyme
VELSKLPGPFLLVGEAKLLQPWRKRVLGAWTESGLELRLCSFPEGAECSAERAESIAKAAKDAGCASLIGWGGGKCLDSVKWAGLLGGFVVAMVPSSAATCACASDVVVAHSQDGEVLDILDLPTAPRLCVGDFGLLASAPRRCLASGMADSLAKWMEWEAVEPPEGGGAAEAEKAKGLVLDPDTAQEQIWDANLRLAAEASRLGGAPAAAAHSFCAGISLDSRSRQWMHGEWVGLGLRFQSMLLGEDPGALDAWLAGLGLPLKLPFWPKDPLAAAERMLRSDESIHLMRGGVPTPQAILDTLEALRE